MSTDLVNIEALAGAFGDDTVETQETFNIASLSTRNSKFTIRKDDDSQVVKDDSGQPARHIDAVIVGATAKNQQFFSGPFIDGEATSPECYSYDCKAPHARATKKQDASCLLCPKAQFGSAVSMTGKPSRACKEFRYLAVVPYSDIPNEKMGGAMRLKVPVMALKALDAYIRELASFGKKLPLVKTKISFDPDSNYPRLTFSRVCDLTAPEVQQVLDVYKAKETRYILQLDEPEPVAIPVQEPVTAPIPEPVQAPVQAAAPSDLPDL